MTVSALFHKGKGVCWKMMIKNDLFAEIKTQLGDDLELSQQIKLVLERYVCRVYGSKDTVNAIRFDMFESKQKKGVMVDLSNLPTNQFALYLHLESANYVARLWTLGGVPMLNPPSPIGSGWDESKTCSQTKFYQTFSKQIIQIARRITVILRMSIW